MATPNHNLYNDSMVRRLGMAVPKRKEVSFEEVFRKEYPRVRQFFIRHGCSYEESEDLTQDTFLRAHRSFGDFRFEAKPSTWIHKIAINVWRNCARDATAAKRDGKEVPLPEGGQGDPAIEGGLQDDFLVNERRQRLRQAIDELPARMRLCVQHRVYQQRSYGEIAKLVGVEATTAKSQLSLAKRKLRSRLADHYPELEEDPADRKG